MAAEEPVVEPQDGAAVDAYEAALDAFAEKLNLLHIASGFPSYATVASASVRPRLTTTGLNEMLSGKRLPSLEALLEYLRVVTTPRGLDKPAAARFRADAALVEEWRGHWQDAKLLQRRAQAASKRVRATIRQVHEDAVREAEALRAAARAEAEHIRTSAYAEAEDIRARAVRAGTTDGGTAGSATADGSATTDGGTTDGGRPDRPGRRGSVGLPAALAVAVVAVVAILVGDSFTGTPGDCQDDRTRAAVPSGGHGAVRPVAFAAEPASLITFPPGHSLLRGFPTPSTSPLPQQSPTPSPSTTPALTPTPTPTPAPSRSAHCANRQGGS
ncbi:hypothetical protein [Streptomyces sp. NPDC047014]|uniref:hypothetical protein n=1 Tax=Streptomyces sp. NPDC047014 TaxID=3155736 RepID=UPI0033E78F8E